MNNAQSLCFWRETNLPIGYLSQWYQSDIVENNITFPTAEHYMMYQKAILFKDYRIAKEILKAKHPRDVKSLGRKIKNFDSKVWDENKFQIVKNGNYLKFSQNEKLKKYLLSTNNKVLIEASPYDNIWGIGIDEKDYFSGKDFFGLNLLGKALMEVRQLLSN